MPLSSRANGVMTGVSAPARARPRAQRVILAPDVPDAAPYARSMRSPGRPRGVPLVLSLQALVVALVVAWFATGHASAPDGGLQQLDVLVVHERVPGLAPVSGRPTIVFTAGCSTWRLSRLTAMLPTVRSGFGSAAAYIRSPLLCRAMVASASR